MSVAATRGNRGSDERRPRRWRRTKRTEVILERVADDNLAGDERSHLLADLRDGRRALEKLVSDARPLGAVVDDALRRARIRKVGLRARYERRGTREKGSAGELVAIGGCQRRGT